ncbi:MAG: hypothetical protein GX288_10935 [Clostridiales bacterium]|nr:hypothetical protein [Clostridiales bacterium]
MRKQTRLDESANIYQHREMKSEKEKLREMSWRDRVSYLWDYYRVHGLVIVLSISLIVYIFYKLITPDIETRFYAAFINSPINPDSLKEYQTEFHEHLNLDPELEEVFFNDSFYFGSPSEYSIAMRQALQVYVANKEIDVIIAPESEFQSLNYIGFFDDLSDQLPTDLYSALTNSFYIASNQDDIDANQANPEKRVYGIYLTDLDLYSAYTKDPYIIGIVANSNYKHNSVEYIRYLFNIFP